LRLFGKSVYLAAPKIFVDMEYGKIISVTGIAGLFELVGSKKDGAIVRSLEDKSTRFVASRVHNFSHLESIEVYTVRDNVNLVDVFKAMSASSEPLPAEKDSAAVKAYFQKVFPDMDVERVYASDMKKMVKWFTILQANNVELKLSEYEGEEEEGESEPSTEENNEQPTEAVAVDEPAAEAAPKKKATRKKKTEE
jgi:hypothetical protein